MWKLNLVLCVVLVSCNSTKNVSSFSIIEKQITFEKTKIKITSNALGNITLKGYISLYQDSLVCFKFYGPFSIEALSGVCKDTFKVYDNFNKVLYPNFNFTIFEKAGLRIDRKVLQFLLMGKVLEFQNELIKLNPTYPNIQTSVSLKKSDILIFNDTEQKRLKFKILLKNLVPKSISISYKDPFTNWDANIEYIDISNSFKKCNFGF